MRMKYNDYASNKFRDTPKNAHWVDKSDRQRRREHKRFLDQVFISCVNPVLEFMSDDEKYKIYLAYENGPGQFHSGGMSWFSSGSSLTWIKDVSFEGNINQFLDLVIQYTEEFQKYKKKLRDVSIDRLLLSDKN